MESRMYQRIKPIEALGRARAQKMDVTDNIGAVIQTSNRVRIKLHKDSSHPHPSICIDC